MSVALLVLPSLEHYEPTYAAFTSEHASMAELTQSAVKNVLNNHGVVPNTEADTEVTMDGFNIAGNDTLMEDQDSMAGLPESENIQSLTSETDTPDAEVMGPYNLATIAVTTSMEVILNSLDHGDAHVNVNLANDGHENTLHWFEEDHGIQLPSITNDGTLVDNGEVVVEMNMNAMHHMDQVAQQLQDLEDQQLHGGATFVNQHFFATADKPAIPMTIALSPANSYGSLGVHQISATNNFTYFPASMTITADNDEVEDQYNLGLGDFLYTWSVVGEQRANRLPKVCLNGKRTPSRPHLETMRSKKPTIISKSDLQHDVCDFQGIDWVGLGVKREESRYLRKKTYRSYLNLKPSKYQAAKLQANSIQCGGNYFRFQKMDLTQKLHYAHFQLRNLIACTSRNSVFYSGRSKVYATNPLLGGKHVKMDLTDPIAIPTFAVATDESGISISTIAANHGILAAGGFGGEYAISSTNTTSSAHFEGLLTDRPNAITNHIDIILNRHSYTPQGVFSSNDCGFRIVDLLTEKFVHEKFFDFAINCTATSPDSRLRVAVGDMREVYILNAETSEILQRLPGHEDFGFACAWADNGWHVATANQDRMIHLWDARMWTDSSGKSRIMKSISAHQAGVRSLKFSPVGSGKRVLVAAEQADVVSIIEAETYESKQHLDFFGEILGTAFSADGQDLYVGINDQLRGGIMQFEKCGLSEDYTKKRRHQNAGENSFGGSFEEAEDRWVRNSEGVLVPLQPEHVFRKLDAGLDWKQTLEETVVERKSKRTMTWHRRRAAGLGDPMPFL